jgi:tetratricopeptide (TPR) repeat protein
LTHRYWRADTLSAWTWARLGEAYLFAGNHAEAARLFAGALARDSASKNSYTWRSTALPLAFLYRNTGREDEIPLLIARSYAHADSLIARGQEPWSAYYQHAALALIEDDREGALRWLRAAYEAGMPGPVLIETDPLLAELRGDPKFEETVERLRSRVVEIRIRLGLKP